MTVIGTAGHMQRCTPLMAALVDRGVETVVYTDRAVEGQVVATGARFADLYAGRPLDAADDASRPRPCRYVTFAGTFADDVAREVALVRPSLMISDAFAVVGRVVADILDVPHVNICSGHDVDPTRFVELQLEGQQVDISPRCHAAVETLRDRYGLEDASPFSYGTGMSPLLNISGEPELFMSEGTRRALGPVAFFGSLATPEVIAERQRPREPRWFGADGADLRLYVSFGTVIWRYFAAEALASMASIAQVMDARPGSRAIFSLGRADVPASAVDRLRRPNVIVESYVDQWQVLGEADVFITHHGLNSTHESIYSLVPMISHPFLGDQLAMATFCQEQAIAVPLTSKARDVIDTHRVEAALDRCRRDAPALEGALGRVRQADLDVVAHRPEVIERILALC
jgi:UDP:flavonoid glycosyltransferase YjiC (YdhE family)